MFYRRIAIYICAIVFLSAASSPLYAQDRDAVVARLSESLGHNSLKEAPFLMFSSVSAHLLLQGEHSFLFDWNDKLCRFEGHTKDGQELIVLFHAEKKTGKVFVNKKQIDNPDLLKNIVQLFEDDSFLLFTPLRIATEDLDASLQDTEIINSKKYFVLNVNTPGARYESNKLYIDSQNGNLSLWKTYDKKANKTHELIVSRIKDAGGGLTLPTVFSDKVSRKVFQYPIVAAFLNIEESKFKNP